MYKRVTITMPEELAEQWSKMVEKHSLVKSRMITNYLETVLPYLEQREPHSIINFRIEDNSKTLFDDDFFNAEYDQSVEDYKAKKRA